MLNALKAKWTLQSLTGQPDLGNLFGQKMPFLQFDTDEMRVTGNNGCNNLSGPFTLSGTQIDFGELITTKMACPGNGESLFMNALQSVTDLKVSGNALTLLNGARQVMTLDK